MHTPVAVTERRDAASWPSGVRTDVVAVGGGSTTGLGQGDRAPHRSAADRGADDLRRLGDDADPRRDARTAQKVTQSEPQGPARGRDLRRRPDADAAARRCRRTSGINAIAHAVEALYAQDRNPDHVADGGRGRPRAGRALPRIVDERRADREARSDALYGAWLCGICLGAVGMALHHKLCHTLGGTFDLPHAETHTAVLPHALAYNAPAVPDVMRQPGRGAGDGRRRARPVRPGRAASGRGVP